MVTSVLRRLTTRPVRLRPRTNGGRFARTNTIVKIEGAEVEARWEGVLSDLACLLDDGVDGQSKEDRPQRIALLNSPGAGNGLIKSSAGAREKTTIKAITAAQC